MIVLEGSDCAGKTTIAMRLAQELSRLGVLKRFEKYGLLPKWWDYSHMYIRSCESWSVIDRFVVSEYVYGLLWRGGANAKLLMNINRVAEAMNAVGALTVFVRPPIWVLEQRLKYRGDELIKHCDLDHVCSWYDSYLARDTCAITKTPVLQITGQDLEADVKKVLDAYATVQKNTLKA